jgi:hypothetical protein
MCVRRPPRRTARPIDLLQANGARGVLSCARAAVTAWPADRAVRSCAYVRALVSDPCMRACYGPGIERQLRGLHGEAPGRTA